MEKSKNQKLLESFSAYCKMYPEQRFWQALRNFAGVHAIGVTDMVPMPGQESKVIWDDTFYSDNQDGR